MQSLSQHTSTVSSKAVVGETNMSSTTLGEAICAVPELQHSCCTVMTRPHVAGPGIKNLRLVSKQLRVAMVGMMKGYTLCLDGSAADLIDKMNLLQSARISRLTVIVKAKLKGGWLLRAAFSCTEA